jgi:hypothetical protein
MADIFTLLMLVLTQQRAWVQLGLARPSVYKYAARDLSENSS